jgi:hypothetical protein
MGLLSDRDSGRIGQGKARMAAGCQDLAYRAG